MFLGAVTGHDSDVNVCHNPELPIALLSSWRVRFNVGEERNVIGTRSGESHGVLTIRPYAHYTP